MEKMEKSTESNGRMTSEFDKLLSVAAICRMRPSVADVQVETSSDTGNKRVRGVHPLVSSYYLWRLTSCRIAA